MSDSLNAQELSNNRWSKFQRYYAENGHLRIPRRDRDLGKVVHAIRTKKAFLSNDEFKSWLDERNFF